MRLLTRDHDNFSLTEFPPSKIPLIYAVLSHRWGPDEVTLKDLESDTVRSRAGYRKLQFCADQAARDGILYFWIDTCCIDKSSSNELSEAINSMFKWYQNATKCYVYLPDVSTKYNVSPSSSNDTWESAFQASTWFTRGWTLQELIAPKVVEFFSLEGEYLGDKISLKRQILEITGLPVQALQTSALSEFDVEERLSWSARRITTIEEDIAYSLLGLFDIQMPLLYGEGREKALARLKRKAYKSLSPTSLNISRTPHTVPFERNPRFTGRESELTRLGQALFANDYTSRWAVTGLGGVGKTQLVLELLFRTKAKYPDCAILWIPAVSHETLHQGYLAVARQLNMPRGEDESTSVQIQVQRYLTEVHVGRWLLVFDNADDIDMWMTLPEIQNRAAVPQSTHQTSHLIDTLPQNRQGCILFTTRDKKLAIKLAGPNILALSEMAENPAMSLLGKHVGDLSLAGQQEDVRKLLAKLTCLPLAIVQAGTYIVANGITVAEYLDLLEQKEEEVVGLLSEAFEDHGRYRVSRNPIALTWLCSFEQIQKRDQLAADYLSFMACILPKDIPDSILPAASSSRRQKEAIGTLKAYSLVSQDPSGNFLNLHRLVHLATRNWLRKELIFDIWVNRTLARLEKVFPVHDDEYRNIWRMYLPHVLQILESDGLDRTGRHTDELLVKCGRCLCEDGRWDEAERMFLQAKRRSKSGDSVDYRHDELYCEEWLVYVYRNQGRYTEAEELQLRILEADTAQSGANSDDTLSSKNEMANIYRVQGRWKEAEALYIEVLEVHKARLGMDHLSTLACLGNLANTYSAQGRWQEAEKLQLQVLELRKVKLGVDHLDTLLPMYHLAYIYLQQGRLTEAEGLSSKLVEVYKARLGPDHPYTLTSMDNLAYTYCQQGRLTEAEGLSSQVVEKRKARLGQEHPDTLSSTNDLALIYRKQGRLMEAEELQVRVLELSKTKQGKDNPDTLICMHNLAHTWKGLGRDAEAVQLMEDCVDRSAQVLGLQHPFYLSSVEYLREWKAELAESTSENGQLPSSKSKSPSGQRRWKRLLPFRRATRK